MKKIALQLYSLKDVIGTDVDGAFARLAAMGYDGVEFAGFYGLEAGEMKRLLDKHGLTPFSSHVGQELLRQDAAGTIAYHKAIGCPVLVVPSAPFDSAQAIGEFAAFMEGTAAELQRQGLRLGYHNHSHEFRQFEGRYGLDLFFEKAPHVEMQLDVCWCYHAGVPVTDYLKAHRPGCTMLHMKDMKWEDGRAVMTPVGAGEVDMPALLGEADGIDLLIVENEDTGADPFDDAKASIKYLRSLL
jgi:AP endonuclease, family 2